MKSEKSLKDGKQYADGSISNYKSLPSEEEEYRQTWWRLLRILCLAFKVGVAKY